MDTLLKRIVGVIEDLTLESNSVTRNHDEFHFILHRRCSNEQEIEWAANALVYRARLAWRLALELDQIIDDVRQDGGIE